MSFSQQSSADFTKLINNTQSSLEADQKPKEMTAYGDAN
jgi:hypothetical protein